MRPTNSNKLFANRLFGLDLLRAIAIVLVMIDHSKFFLSSEIPFINHLHIASFYGVELFFVLSGFLIGNQLLNIFIGNNRATFADLVNFWKRRWFRTLPNYYLVFTILLLLHWNISSELAWWKYLVFLQNFSHEIPNFFMVSWSLSIEEWFYFGMPILLFLAAGLTKNTSAKRSLYLLSILIFISFFTLLRFTNSSAEQLDWNLGIRQVLIYRLDAVGFGLLLSYFQRYYGDKLSRHRILLFITASLLMLLNSYWYFRSSNTLIISCFIFTAVSLSFAMILPYFSALKAPKSSFALRCVTQMSLISYSLYLVNYDLVLWPLSRFYSSGNTWWSVFFLVLFWGLSIALANLIFRYFEKPILLLREKYAPKVKFNHEQ